MNLERLTGKWQINQLPLHPQMTQWHPLFLLSITCSMKSASRPVTSDSVHPTVCGPPGSSVHGILQAAVLEWVAIPFSKASSPARDQPWSPALRVASTIWAAREVPSTQHWRPEVKQSSRWDLERVLIFHFHITAYKVLPFNSPEHDLGGNSFPYFTGN